jgi:hypothetical protein
MRVSRISFVAPVLLAGVQYKSLTESDQWASNSAPPEVRSFSLDVDLQKGYVTVTKCPEGFAVGTPLTNVIDWTFYKDEVVAHAKKKGE